MLLLLRSLLDSAGGSSTGSLASTQGANFTTANGTVAVAGTVAVTQGLNTLAAAGAVAITGTVAVTQGLNTCAAAGTVFTSVTGTVARTQGANFTTIAAAMPVAGTLARTQELNTCAAVGTVSLPSVTETAGGNTADSYIGCQDTWINSGNVTQNNGTSLIFGVFNDTANPTHGLMAFGHITDVTGGPVRVTASTINIDTGPGLTGVAPNPETFTVYSMLRPWTEAGATWNTYDGTNNWGTAGALSNGVDRDTTPVMTQTVSTAANVFHPFSGGNLNQLVQDWINGARPNYGVMFKRTDAANDGGYVNLSSIEGASDGFRPYISFTYVRIGAISGSMSPGYQYQQPNFTTASGSILTGSSGSASVVQLPNVLAAAGNVQPIISGSAGVIQQLNTTAIAAQVRVSGTSATVPAKDVLTTTGGAVLTLGIVVAGVLPQYTTASGIVLAPGAYTPGAPERFYTINPENRVYVATAPPGSLPTTVADRVYVVNAENRIDSAILAENRGYVINAENRVIVATAENRIDTI